MNKLFKILVTTVIIGLALSGCLEDTEGKVSGGIDPIEVNIDPDVDKTTYVMVTSEGSRFVKVESDVDLVVIYKFDDGVVLPLGWHTLEEAQAYSINPDPSDTALDTFIRDGGEEMP